MKLLICLVTYERLAYTRKTLRYLWKNTSDDASYYIIVVDNHSTDGTQDYLKKLEKRDRVNEVLLNEENFYPGKACNLGWEKALKKYNATHLMRLDNDMFLEKNWDKQVTEYFKAIPELGQLGLEHEAIETPGAELYRRVINGYTVNEWPGCVGGPMVMPRKLWDEGLRYDETPWEPPHQEDSKLSASVKAKGYLVGHAQEELGRTFATLANRDEFPEYYKKTMGERGIPL